MILVSIHVYFPPISLKVLHTQGVINTRPALLERQAVSTSVALRQRLHQRLRLTGRQCQALREPAVDRRQQRVGLGALACCCPEATEAHGGPELQRFASGGGRRPERAATRFPPPLVAARLPQGDAERPTCLPAAVLMLLDQGVGLGQRLEAVVRVAQVGRDVRQHSA